MASRFRKVLLAALAVSLPPVSGCALILSPLENFMTPTEDVAWGSFQLEDIPAPLGVAPSGVARLVHDKDTADYTVYLGSLILYSTGAPRVGIVPIGRGAAFGPARCGVDIVSALTAPTAESDSGWVRTRETRDSLSSKFYVRLQIPEKNGSWTPIEIHGSFALVKLKRGRLEHSGCVANTSAAPNEPSARRPLVTIPPS